MASAHIMDVGVLEISQSAESAVAKLDDHCLVAQTQTTGIDADIVIWLKTDQSPIRIPLPNLVCNSLVM